MNFKEDDGVGGAVGEEQEQSKICHSEIPIKFMHQMSAADVPSSQTQRDKSRLQFRFDLTVKIKVVAFALHLPDSRCERLCHRTAGKKMRKNNIKNDQENA